MLTWCGGQLGGKDPAYVRHDADLDYTVAELVDGASLTFGLTGAFDMY